MMAATESGDKYETIKLSRWRGYWIATDELRDISSSPERTRQAALEDLDENVALAEGELDLSQEAKQAIQESEGELERGETKSLTDMERDCE